MHFDPAVPFLAICPKEIIKKVLKHLALCVVMFKKEKETSEMASRLGDFCLS